jgi:hypothetical protein
MDRGRTFSGSDWADIFFSGLTFVLNSFLRNASFWDKSKESRRKRREKITPLIMATTLAPLAHALRSDQFVDSFPLDKTSPSVSQVLNHPPSNKIPF